MRTFLFLINDRRYSVPTLNIVTAPDEATARALAQQRLDETDHHFAVEVLDGSKELFRLCRGGCA
jgi:hypothetical protein